MVAAVLDLLEQLLRSGVHIQFDCTIRLAEPVHDQNYHVCCEYCHSWEKSYSSSESASRGLRAHLQHCAAYAQVEERESLAWISAMHE
jgi:hypothetical protein